MFEDGNVVRFKGGPEMFYLWGDRVTLEYFLISSDQSNAEEGHVKTYSHPYTMEFPVEDLELVAEDEFDEFPNDFMDGWIWWNGLDDEQKDDYTGPNWMEYLG